MIERQHPTAIYDTVRLRMRAPSVRAVLPVRSRTRRRTV